MSTKLNQAARRRLRRGLTLIEAAMALVVMLVVIAGAMLMYQSASSNWKTADAQSQIGAVAQAIRSQYAGQPSYTGLAAAQLVKNLPSKMVNGTALVNSFNGTIVIAAANAGGGAGSGFTITFNGLPSDACVKLAASDMGRSISAIKIGSTTAAAAPATPAEAAAGCTAAGNANTVAWTMS